MIAAATHRGKVLQCCGWKEVGGGQTPSTSLFFFFFYSSSCQAMAISCFCKSTCQTIPGTRDLSASHKHRILTSGLKRMPLSTDKVCRVWWEALWAGWAECGDKEEIGLNSRAQCHCEANHHLLHIIYSLFGGHGKFLESVWCKDRTHNWVSKTVRHSAVENSPGLNRGFSPLRFYSFFSPRATAGGRFIFRCENIFLTLLHGAKLLSVLSFHFLSL